MTDYVHYGERWAFKPNRGTGSFTVVGVDVDRVTLRNRRGKDKRISRQTLRSDYKRVRDPRTA